MSEAGDTDNVDPTGGVPTTKSPPVKEPAEPPAPNVVASPKRGAFPTPKPEIDLAEPYVPESDQH